MEFTLTGLTFFIMTMVETQNFEEWMNELNRIATEEYDQFERDPENPVWRRDYFENGDSPRQALHIEFDHVQ